MPADGVPSLSGYRGRIAPSPTGYLHLGHARTFLIAQQRAAAGALVLRVDDLDAQRCRPEFDEGMLQDLHWLGIHWSDNDASSVTGFDASSSGLYRQSERRPLYAAALKHLQEQGFVYPCSCSRRDLQAIARAPHAEDDDEPLYPGTCRGRTSIAGVQTAWRFRVPDGEAIPFVDGNLGPQSFVAGQDFGDFLVARRDGLPSYQLACVVDDAAMRITEVVRGRDLLRSTARQILLQRALGLPTPAYFHCELAVDEAGARLAKRHDALSIRALREAGHTLAELRAMEMMMRVN